MGPSTSGWITREGTPARGREPAACRNVTIAVTLAYGHKASLSEHDRHCNVTRLNLKGYTSREPRSSGAFALP
jgi:hypothetical protein